MKYVEIGGVKVSNLAFGTAWNPKTQQNTLLADPENATRVIHHAMDSGINLFDTAPAYGTEELLANALGRKRKHVLISTKSPRQLSIRAGWQTCRDRIYRSFEESCRLFDKIDFYFFHTITAGVYDKAMEEGILQEVADRVRRIGGVQFVGISEDLNDHSHLTAWRALRQKPKMFDAIMGKVTTGFPYVPCANRDIAVFAMRANAGNPVANYKAAARKASVVLMSTSSIKHLDENLGAFDESKADARHRS